MALPIYAAELQNVCLHADILTTTQLEPILCYLCSLPPPPPLGEVLSRLISRAHAVPLAAAPAFASPYPSFDIYHAIPVAATLTRFFLCLSHEGPPLTAALAHLLPSSTPEALQTLCGMLASGVDKCSSWRRKVTCDIMARVALPAAAPLAPARLAPALAGLPAAARLHALLAQRAQELKDAAFERTFIAPLSAYAAAAGGMGAARSLEADLEAHGVPTLVALLAATTGVAVSRATPVLEDQAKGFADGAAATAPAALAALWDPQNLSRSAAALYRPPASASAEAAQPWYGRRPQQPHLPYNDFCGWEGGEHITVREFAQRAAQGGGGAAPASRYASVYLRAFARYLAPDFLLPRLTAALLAEPGEDLSAVVAALCAAGEGGEGGEEQSPGEWLYRAGCGGGEESSSMVLDMGRAWALLEGLGVLKQAGAIYSAPSAQPQPLFAQLLQPHAQQQPPLPRAVPASAITSIQVAGGQERGAERAANLLQLGQEEWNKWLHPQCGGRSWVQVSFARPLTLSGYGLQSANDAPERDPVAWRLLLLVQGEGSARSAQAWHKAHSVDARGGGAGEAQGFSARWQWRSFEFGAVPGCVGARLEIGAVRECHWPNDHVQLGCIQFFLGGAAEGAEGAAKAAPQLAHAPSGEVAHARPAPLQAAAPQPLSPEQARAQRLAALEKRLGAGAGAGAGGIASAAQLQQQQQQPLHAPAVLPMARETEAAAQRAAAAVARMQGGGSAAAQGLPPSAGR